MGCSVGFKYAKMHWRTGLRPDPTGGAHNAPQTSYSVGERDTSPNAPPPSGVLDSR